MLKCDSCGDSPVYRVRIEKGLGYCDKCLRNHSYVGDVTSINKTIILMNTDGTTMKTTQSEINEVKRLRILPYERDGGWYPGRMGDNGKIQEGYLK